jgi:hypothetical protein
MPTSGTDFVPDSDARILLVTVDTTVGWYLKQRLLALTAIAAY